jgi:hypothetical protein
VIVDIHGRLHKRIETTCPALSALSSLFFEAAVSGSIAILDATLL